MYVVALVPLTLGAVAILVLMAIDALIIGGALKALETCILVSLYY
jgi:hypothetical protein